MTELSRQEYDSRCRLSRINMTDYYLRKYDCWWRRLWVLPLLQVFSTAIFCICGELRGPFEFLAKIKDGGNHHLEK